MNSCPSGWAKADRNPNDSAVGFEREIRAIAAGRVVGHQNMLSVDDPAQPRPGATRCRACLSGKGRPPTAKEGRAGPKHLERTDPGLAAVEKIACPLGNRVRVRGSERGKIEIEYLLEELNASRCHAGKGIA